MIKQRIDVISVFASSGPYHLLVLLLQSKSLKIFVVDFIVDAFGIPDSVLDLNIYLFGNRLCVV